MPRQDSAGRPGLTEEDEDAFSFARTHKLSFPEEFPISEQPEIIVIGGPNGAGKSTVARFLIPDAIPFVNADEIARAQMEGQASDVDRQAARIMLARLDSLENERLSFAVETTLASRALATRIVRLKANGYRFHLYYMWIDSADLAVQRIAERVRMGGHNIPEETVRRRYKRSIINFARIYMPIADKWHVYNNRTENIPELVADGDNTGNQTVYGQDSWNRLLKESGS